MPDPIIDGKPFKTERVPGMIFYNGLGDECGGLIFGVVKGGDYITLASDGRLLAAAWTDGRDGAARIYVRTIELRGTGE